MAVVVEADLDLGLLVFQVEQVAAEPAAAMIELGPQQQQIPEVVVVVVEYQILPTAEQVALV
jgi:hypothetical protein